MKQIFVIFLLSISVISCKHATTKQSKSNVISTEAYELIIAHEVKTLLIIFPGGGSDINSTKRDFKIEDNAIENNISLLFMNYARLWLETPEIAELDSLIQTILIENNLHFDSIILGGMSIGGSTALRMADHFSTQNELINPTGVFIVDSPIDLYGLYESSLADCKRSDLTEDRLQEPRWIMNTIETKNKGYRNNGERNPHSWSIVDVDELIQWIKY